MVYFVGGGNDIGGLVDVEVVVDVFFVQCIGNIILIFCVIISGMDVDDLIIYCYIFVDSSIVIDFVEDWGVVIDVMDLKKIKKWDKFVIINKLC